MKYWNKSKDIRERAWTKVVGPSGTWPFPKEQLFKVTYYTAKLMCQRMPNKRKFYCNGVTNDWWFEHPADATMFLILISGTFLSDRK